MLRQISRAAMIVGMLSMQAALASSESLGAELTENKTAALGSVASLGVKLATVTAAEKAAVMFGLPAAQTACYNYFKGVLTQDLVRQYGVVGKALGPTMAATVAGNLTPALTDGLKTVGHIAHNAVLGTANVVKEISEKGFGTHILSTTAHELVGLGGTAVAGVVTSGFNFYGPNMAYGGTLMVTGNPALATVTWLAMDTFLKYVDVKTVVRQAGAAVAQKVASGLASGVKALLSQKEKSLSDEDFFSLEAPTSLDKKPISSVNLVQKEDKSLLMIEDKPLLMIEDKSLLMIDNKPYWQSYDVESIDRALPFNDIVAEELQTKGRIDIFMPKADEKTEMPLMIDNKAYWDSYKDANLGGESNAQAKKVGDFEEILPGAKPVVEKESAQNIADDFEEVNVQPKQEGFLSKVWNMVPKFF